MQVEILDLKTSLSVTNEKKLAAASAKKAYTISLLLRLIF